MLRITRLFGGLIIVVPGARGFQRDSDHKVFYGEEQLRQLDARWSLVRLFSIPLFVKSEILSKSVRQYALIAVYKKNSEDTP